MIITVANQKGGVGKTDLAVNLSSHLAFLGKKTLLIDLDPQANATDYLLPEKNKIKKTSADLLISDKIRLQDVVLETQIKNLHIVPGHHSLNAAQVELMNDVGMQFRLKRKIRKTKSYDYIIIDTPPSLGMLTVNALTASDHVLVPIQTHYFATDGVEKLMSTINAIKKEINPKIDVKGYVLTMYDKRNKLSSAIEKLVRKKFGEKVLKTHIPINVELTKAPIYHKPIILHSKSSRGAYAYMNLAKEFLSLYKDN